MSLLHLSCRHLRMSALALLPTIGGAQSVQDGRVDVILSSNSSFIYSCSSTSAPTPPATVSLSAGTYRLYVSAEANVRASAPPERTACGMRSILNFNMQFAGTALVQASGSVSVTGLPQLAINQAVTQPISWAQTRGLANSFGPVLGVAQIDIVPSISGLFLNGSATASAFYSPSSPPLSAPIAESARFLINIDFTIGSATQVHITSSVSADVPGLGEAQASPIVPSPPSGTSDFPFTLAPTGRWFDPPLALGYDFQQSGSSLFADILSLPVGIDGDGLFEVLVGTQSLGQFAQGSRVNFVQLLGQGVPAFRISGIDPAADASNVEAFPVQLAFDTPLADFTMTPVTWRKVGTSCSDPAACITCPTVSLETVGQAVTGNTSFSLAIQNGPTGGIGAFYLGIGHPQTNPIPLFCGAVYPQLPVLELGIGFLTGTGTCDGAGSLAVPLPNDPVFFGLFVTAQSAFLCPAGGIGLTHGIEFPIGS